MKKIKKRYLQALSEKVNIVLSNWEYLSFGNNETFREILLSNDLFYIGIYYLESRSIEFNSRYYTQNSHFKIIFDLLKKNKKILQELCYHENIKNPAIK